MNTLKSINMKKLKSNDIIPVIKNNCSNTFIMYPENVFSIADELNITSNEVIEKYLTPYLKAPVPFFISISNGKCSLCDNGKCMVKNKPTACKLYPVVRLYSDGNFNYFIAKENKSDVINTITLNELINSNKYEFTESSLKFYNFVNQAIINGVEKSKKLCESDRAKFLSIILTILYGNYIPNTDSNIDSRYNDVLKFIKTGVVNDD